MNLSQIFILIASVCFFILLLLALEVFGSDDGDAWLAGGLTAFALGHLALVDRRIG